MFLSELGGERISKKTFDTVRHLIDFLKIWRDIEIGENFKIDYDAVHGYLNHLHSVSEFWECENKEDYYSVFEDMAINSQLHLMHFIVLTEWQKEMLRKQGLLKE